MKASLSRMLLSLFQLSPSQAKWQYSRAGSPTNSAATPAGGYALMGGSRPSQPGNEVTSLAYPAERANGGDLLILRVGAGDYSRHNAEIKAHYRLNSVATIAFADRKDSYDSEVVRIINEAGSIFLAGGSQSHYVRYWQDTPVQAALNRHIEMGKPLGGLSAGMAILGEFSFTAMIDTIDSSDALADPYGNKVTLSRDFLRIPLMAGIITDSHFAQRDRLGRLLVFMARILHDGWAPRVRAVAVDENVAVSVEPDGMAHVAGEGRAYFLEATQDPEVCRHREPLTFSGVRVHRVSSGQRFDFKTWEGQGENYILSVVRGVVQAPATGHIY